VLGFSARESAEALETTPVSADSALQRAHRAYGLNGAAAGAAVTHGQTKPHVAERRRRAMSDHKIATREEWLAARGELLGREKEHTRLGDELAQQRRELPWVQVETEYRFDTDEGEKALSELFDGRSQLLVYHFMFGPSYEAGCPVNSSIADAVDGVLPHPHARDVTFLFVSQAPLEKLQAYKRRMGWSFPWVSSAHTDFNFDLSFSRTEEQSREAVALMMDSAVAAVAGEAADERGAQPGDLVAEPRGGLPPMVEQNARSTGTDVVGYLTESPGFSSFVREDGSVYHTYSTTWRGLEFLMGYYPILDHAPKGRDEGEAWQLWIRRHDEYDGARDQSPFPVSVARG
jgi:predicted dithiol-disulfide oxidoreductase (DUF899 family)